MFRGKNRVFFIALLMIFAIFVQTSQPVTAEGTESGCIYLNSISEANKYQTLEEAISASSDGDTLLLSGGNLKVAQTVVIPGDKNLTLDLMGNTLISQVETSMLKINTQGSFTLKNGKLTAEDTDEDGITGRAIDSSQASLTVDSIEAYGFNSGSEGGVIYVSGTVPRVVISNNNFHDNSGVSAGGAISINTQGIQANIQLINNTIKNNRVNGGNYSYGGGVSFTGKGKLEIKGNTFDGNRSNVTNTTYGLYWSHGGALTIESPVNNDGNLQVVLEDNDILNNRTQLFGGGIYFNITEKYGDTLDIKSGKFIGNHSDYAGGAIDYSVHGQPALILKNVIMTENNAYSGAGVWACPTTRTTTYSTFGGVILENLLSDNPAPPYPKAGTDIRFEGRDTKIRGILSDNNPDYHKLTLQERTYNGEKITWYADQPDNLYQEGDMPLASEEYIDRDTSLGARAKLENEENWYNRHLGGALIIFSGNTAFARGGAISTNSDLQIGEEGDVSLFVSKEWVDDEGEDLTEDLPDYIEIELIRKDSNGGTYALETVKLSAENNWECLFDKLPSKGLINGETLTFTYGVREKEENTFFTTTYKNISPTEKATYEIKIINKEKPQWVKPTGPEEPKEPADPGDSSNSDSAKIATGEYGVYPWILLTLLSLAGLIVTIRKKLRLNNKK